VEDSGNLGFDMTPAGSTPLRQGSFFGDDAPSGDPLLGEAADVVRREGKASISMLQRRLRVGYNRAARLIDTLEEQGIIGPQQTGSQVREVLDYGESGNDPPLETEDT
jgi:S-DNA-T family DNA segregation ATPase FtsK/SpoIIIE